jgi:Multimeric flavodoxin WrbA
MRGSKDNNWRNEEMKVVAFNGSPRKEGNTAALIKYALEELEKDGIETEVVQVGGKRIHGCTACGKCYEKMDKKCINDKDIINECIEKMLEADGIILASPTYFADLTPELKALIDRAGFVAKANNEMFKHKVGAAIVAVRRAGSIHVFDSINHFFTISQMIIPGSSYWNMGIGLAEGDVEKDEEGIQTMQTLGQNMAWLLKKLNA